MNYETRAIRICMVSEKSCDNVLRVLDLFCGMGGLSYGFAKTGFEVTGVDISEKAGSTYSLSGIGRFVKMDLMNAGLRGEHEVIIGGPPCEPWSCLNLTRRRENHPRYKCLNAFFEGVNNLRPLIFIMENVPAIKNDPLFTENLEFIKTFYDTSTTLVRYSDYGAAFARHRFFTVGVTSEVGVSASEILDAIEKEKPATVWNAIGDLRDKKRDVTIDHTWPNLKTIHKYLDYYRTGKYGWNILKWDEPSPSFGNIMKTYILHPNSFNNGNEARAISVREALRIVGFPDGYEFPEGLGMSGKYDMIADAVSPVFSLKLAKAVKDVILPYVSM
jgi:DNA (cytosine-5)-methyltransferase 1